MMTYEILCEANKQIKTIDYKGKDYDEVHQRVKVFRMIFPNGGIETKIEHLENGMVIIRATVKNEFGDILGVGHAYEKEGSSFINNTSYIENCETSAIGRALRTLGIGLNTNYASAEEVMNANLQQEEYEKITDEQIKTLETCIPKHNQTVDNVCTAFHIKELKELTVKQFKYLMNKMGEK